MLTKERLAFLSRDDWRHCVWHPEQDCGGSEECVTVSDLLDALTASEQRATDAERERDNSRREWRALEQYTLQLEAANAAARKLVAELRDALRRCHQHPHSLCPDAVAHALIDGIDDRALGADVSINALIDRSSLGEPGAKELRERTPPEIVKRIVDRSKELGADAAGAEPCAHSYSRMRWAFVCGGCHAEIPPSHVLGDPTKGVSGEALKDVYEELRARDGWRSGSSADPTPPPPASAPREDVPGVGATGPLAKAVALVKSLPDALPDTKPTPPDMLDAAAVCAECGGSGVVTSYVSLIAEPCPSCATGRAPAGGR